MKALQGARSAHDLGGLEGVGTAGLLTATISCGFEAWKEDSSTPSQWIY